MVTEPRDPLDALAAGRVVEDVDLATADAGTLRSTLAAAGEPRTFRRCSLGEVDLARIDLSGATFDHCTADGVVLRDAVLDGATVLAGTFAGADLRDADLTDAGFDRVDLSRARLTGARLTDTAFRACRMIGTDLAGLRDLAVTFTADGCNLALAALSDAHLRGWRVTGADLSDADLAGADLRDAVLTGCRLRGTDLTHARLEGTDLRGADLGEITVDTPGRLRGAVVSVDQAADICRALGLTVA